MINLLPVKRALISVYDKSNLIELVKVLEKFGIEIYSSGGTFEFLKNNFLNIKPLSEISGISSLLNGRVKSLHPLVHAAILARKDSEKHLNELREAGVEPLDLVIVNFYPFERVVEKENISELEVIENIDIGGPTLIRSAAKNYESVVVVSSINQYDYLIKELREHNGSTTVDFRRMLAAEAFQRIVEYDIAISRYFSKEVNLNLTLPLEKVLRYGENPHQSAKLYGNFLKIFQPIHGKELSYNNILDIVSAAELVFELDKCACAIIKHNSPCGVALGNSVQEAFEKAIRSDSISAFGGIVAFNQKVDKRTAEKLNEIFLEVIIAPEFQDDALEVLKKKKDRRLILIDKNFKENNSFLSKNEIRSIPDGLLVQSKDKIVINKDELEFVTYQRPDENELEDLIFAFTVAKYVRSNAIVFAKDGMTLGIGGGQTSRVDSVKIAIMKAREFNHNLENSVVASDGFFPFADSVEIAYKAGAKSFIQPGGSVRDSEVIKFANDNNLKMVLTKIRHFKH
ncbi:MAG: bifunctional phosphoribosylaminoimidazolecarboxamide formyltransferase/IMP cyclohydrolase [Ignavibacteria bacterium]